MCRFDCGLIVIRCMEWWDGVPQFNGKTMPKFTMVSLYFLKLTCVFCLEFDF